MAIIEVERLRRAYGLVVAVQDVSFSVAEGEIFGLLGPNGAGKTTTVESVVGLRVPDGGTVRVLGLDPIWDHARMAERVGVQLQESALPAKLKVREALSLYSSFYRHPDDPEHLMEILGLTGKREDYFKRLSGGQKQRLSIALALVGRPTVAVLDELTTGLDPQARRNTWRFIEDIRDRGVTIVLVTHDMEEAQHLCDRVALIDAGRVVALDTPDRLAARGVTAKRVIFEPSAAFDDCLLTGLPEVKQLERHGPRVVVTGSGDVVNDVVLTLARAGVTPREMRLEAGTLEDAFLALTGRGIDAASGAEPPGAKADRGRRGSRAGGRTTAVGSSPRAGGHAAPRTAFGELIRTEWRLARRTPIGLVWGVGLPILLLVVFGSVPKAGDAPAEFGGLTIFESYLPVLIGLSLSMLALVAMPIQLASYRESRVLRRMRTTPVPPSWVLAAQIVVNLVQLLIALLVIVVAGSAFFGSHPPRQVAGFLIALAFGVAAMFALGLWLAAVARTGRAAGAIGALLFYPSAFFAGLWVPVPLMTHVLRTISHLTPLGAAVQAMQESTLGRFPPAQALLVMAGWTAVFAVMSVRQFQWE